MRLFDIDKNLRDLWTKIAEQDGELTQEDLQALEDLNLAKDEKIKGYGIIIRELTNDIADCKAEIDRITEIQTKLKNRREWLSKRLTDFMQGQGIPKFESVEVNISFRKSYQLEGAETSLADGKLPKEFVVVQTVEKADKKAITDFIKNGGKVDGCELIEKQNIQIK